MTMCQPSNCTTCGSSKVKVGDVGTELIVDVCSDVTAATAVNLRVFKPGGVEVSWVPGVYEGHYLRYVIQAGDLDVAGEYRLEAEVTTPDGSWTGDVGSFQVWARGAG